MKKEMVENYKKMLLDFCEEHGRDGIYPFSIGMVDGAAMVGGDPERIVEKIRAIIEALKEVNEWR